MTTTKIPPCASLEQNSAKEQKIENKIFDAWSVKTSKINIKLMITWFKGELKESKKEDNFQVIPKKNNWYFCYVCNIVNFSDVIVGARDSKNYKTWKTFISLDNQWIFQNNWC